jgi:hypothetical protein
MKQVKYFMTEKGINKWLQNNQNKNILDIQFSSGAWGVIYEDQFL